MLVGRLHHARPRVLRRRRALRLDEPAAAWRCAGWSRGWIALAALGVLAKGLIGVVLPALVRRPVAAARSGAGAQMLRLLHPARRCSRSSLVAAPWFVAMQLRYPGLLRLLLRRPALPPLRRSRTSTTPQPFWFYVVAAAAADAAVDRRGCARGAARRCRGRSAGRCAACMPGGSSRRRLLLAAELQAGRLRAAGAARRWPRCWRRR